MTYIQKWFEEESKREAAEIGGPVARILIFSVKEDKNEYPLVKSLTVCTICFDIKDLLSDKVMRLWKSNYMTDNVFVNNSWY